MTRTKHVSAADIDKWMTQAIAVIDGRLATLVDEVAKLTDERAHLEARRKVFAAALGQPPTRRRKAKKKKPTASADTPTLRRGSAAVIDFLTKQRRAVPTEEIAAVFGLTRSAMYQRLAKLKAKGLVAGEGGSWHRAA